MRDAYRDDLAAAELRVRDLEREQTALAAHNAKLEALVSPRPAPLVRAKRIPRPIVQIGAALAATSAIGWVLRLEDLAISALIGLVILGKVGLYVYVCSRRKE